LVVWGVNLGSLWRAVAAIFRWMMPQPLEVAGTIYLDAEKRLCARLTAPILKHNMNGIMSALPKTRPVVAVSAVGDSESEEGLRQVSEEVTYKMLYALTREGDVAEAEAANELRGGLEDLRAYLYASIPKKGPSPWRRLEQAQEIFGPGSDQYRAYIEDERKKLPPGDDGSGQYTPSASGQPLQISASCYRKTPFA
jgi:hypothetical protein